MGEGGGQGVIDGLYEEKGRAISGLKSLG